MSEKLEMAQNGWEHCHVLVKTGEKTHPENHLHLSWDIKPSCLKDLITVIM